MRVDNRLATPVELVFAVWAWNLSRISKVTSAGANLLAAIRLRLFAETSSSAATHEAVADVIELPKGRKREH